MNRPCSLRAALPLIATLLLAGPVAYAQSDLGTIQGIIKDPSGASVPRAKITVRSQAGLERTATSNESGNYTISNIPPSVYSVVVEAQGFKKY
jgi:hypothetical protein